MKITMTVEVHYTPNGVDRRLLETWLQTAIDTAYENGSLTGDSEAEVETYGVEFS